MAANAIVMHRIVTGPLAENCYVVSRGRDAVVVDPGGGAEEIAEHVLANDLDVHAILSTHGHHDHVAAAAEVAEAYGAPFAIHAGESRVLERVNFYRFAIHREGPVEIPQVGIDLAHATRMCFGALDVTVRHTPGHSPGSVCFDVEGGLLTGDTLMTDASGMTDLPESDRLLLERSVRGLARDYPAQTTIHPGHGEPGTLGRAVASTLDERRS